MKRFYAAYGMNTNMGEMAYRCPGAVCIGAGSIADYKLTFRTHADIEACEGSEIKCVVWQITPECECNLDMLEGYPFYYIKKEFVVKLDNMYKNMTHLSAMAYQMTNQTGNEFPGDWYVDCLLEGYAEHGVDVDQIYQALEECSV